MSDNLELGRLETNLGVAAVNTFDTLASRVDARETETLVKAVTSSNAVTITQNELRFVNAIRFTDSGSSAAITATIDADDDDQSPPVAKDMGGYDVINLTANAITIEITGQSATAPVVAAGETARVNITATDVRGIGGAGGGGSITVTDEGGSALTTALASLDFVGSGVTATNTGDAVTVTVPGAGGGSVDAAEGGSAVVVGASSFNFAAADFNITDEGSGVAGIALAGGGGGGTSQKTKVTLNANQNISTANETNILWNGPELSDDGGWHSTVTNPDRITPGAGRYDMMAFVRLSGVNAGEDIRLLIRHYDSGDNSIGALSATRLYGQNAIEVNLSVIDIELAAGDYVVVAVDSNSDTNYDVIAVSSYFMVRSLPWS